VSDRGKGRGEGIPLTPLEAMACGTPIIVGNQDGSQEAVVDNLNGYCIDPFDLNSHKIEMNKLLSSNELHIEKSHHALRLARTLFSYEEFKEKHRQFLKKNL
jgi:phosphatidylinositol alpha-1,6-mannosyltransferase